MEKDLLPSIVPLRIFVIAFAPIRAIACDPSIPSFFLSGIVCRLYVLFKLCANFVGRHKRTKRIVSFCPSSSQTNFVTGIGLSPRSGDFTDLRSQQHRRAADILQRPMTTFKSFSKDSATAVRFRRRTIGRNPPFSQLGLPMQS